MQPNSEPTISISDLDDQIDATNRRAAALRRELELLDVRLGVLDDLRKELQGRSKAKRAADSISDPARESGNGKPGVAKGLRQFITAHPFEFTRAEVISHVEDKISTTAKNPARSMYATMWTWLQKGRMELDDQERIGPAQRGADRN